MAIEGFFTSLLSLFFSFSVEQVLVLLRKQFINNFAFPTWAFAAGFNNNNNSVVPCQMLFGQGTT